MPDPARAKAHRRDRSWAQALALTAALALGPVRGEPGPAVPQTQPVAQTLPLPEPPWANPMLNRHYRGGDPQQRTRDLEGPGREVFEQRLRIVHETGVGPGMRVADIGAGAGHFAVLFARAVGPEGKVYALDTEPGFVAGIEAGARSYRVQNLTPRTMTEQGTGLEAASIDLAFFGGSYRRFEDPAALLESIRRALVPYGSLVIVDAHPRPGLVQSWTSRRERAGRNEVLAEVQSAGFRLVESKDFMRQNYFLKVERLGDDPDLEVGPIETLAPEPAPGLAPEGGER
jgi:precorrin-6B methylase 2